MMMTLFFGTHIFVLRKSDNQRLFGDSLIIDHFMS